MILSWLFFPVSAQQVPNFLYADTNHMAMYHTIPMGILARAGGGAYRTILYEQELTPSVDGFIRTDPVAEQTTAFLTGSGMTGMYPFPQTRSSTFYSTAGIVEGFGNIWEAGGWYNVSNTLSPGQPQRGAMVRKHDLAGHILWEHLYEIYYPPSVNGMVPLRDNSLIFSGVNLFYKIDTSGNLLQMYSGFNPEKLAPFSGNGFWGKAGNILMLFDLNAHVQWSQNLGFRIEKVCGLPDGTCWVAGNTPARNAVIVHVDSTGSVLDGRMLSASNGFFCLDMDRFQNGDLVLAGGETPDTSETFTLVRLDSAGNFLFASEHHPHMAVDSFRGRIMISAAPDGGVFGQAVYEHQGPFFSYANFLYGNQFFKTDTDLSVPCFSNPVTLTSVPYMPALSAYPVNVTPMAPFQHWPFQEPYRGAIGLGTQVCAAGPCLQIDSVAVPDTVCQGAWVNLNVYAQHQAASSPQWYVDDLFHPVYGSVWAANVLPGPHDLLLFSDGVYCGTYMDTFPVFVRNTQLNPGFYYSTSTQYVQFTASQAPGAGVQYFWDFGDGNTSTAYSPLHQYASGGTYTVCLTVTNPCNPAGVQSCQALYVPCAVQFNPAFTSSIQGDTVSFTDITSGNPTIWIWSFGDGDSSTVPNPVHIYPGPGTYPVCLTATDGCSQQSTCDQLVIPCPAFASGFSFSTTLLSASFQDTSQNATGWQWDFGDGNQSTLASPQHTFAAPGTYTVCRIVTDGCATDTSCQTLTVCDTLSADYSYQDQSPQLVFQNLSQGADTVLWTFGDGQTSSLQSPTHTYAQDGVYTVCLYVWNACTADSLCDSVQVVFTSRQHPGMAAWHLYPVPADREIHLTSAALPSGNVHFSVYDMLGKRVLADQTVHTGGMFQHTIPLSGLPAGCFHIRVQAPDGVHAFPFIHE